MSDFVKPVVTGIPSAINKGVKPVKKNGDERFDDIFRQEYGDAGIKVSRHAVKRMEQRNIDVSPAVREKVEKAIDLASKKGIRDSLILTEDAAFVVNIYSKTIVTAIEKDGLKEKVFTNIDGAVYL